MGVIDNDFEILANVETVHAAFDGLESADTGGDF